MKYICIKQCYWEERIWDLGTVVERPNDVKVPEHFRPVTPGVVKSVKAETAKDEVSPEDDEGSAVRETLKKLCGKNGIPVTTNTSSKSMREQLSEKGIVVS
jgi:hypothetical protein